MLANGDIHRETFLEITRKIWEGLCLTLLLFIIVLLFRKRSWTFSQVLGDWLSSRNGATKRRRRKHTLYQYWTQRSQRQSVRKCQFCQTEEKLFVRYVSNARTRNAPVRTTLFIDFFFFFFHERSWTCYIRCSAQCI